MTNDENAGLSERLAEFEAMLETLGPLQQGRVRAIIDAMATMTKRDDPRIARLAVGLFMLRTARAQSLPSHNILNEVLAR